MLNRVVLVGRLTKDPDLRYTQSGVAVANFTIAVNRPFVKEGQNQREADFINCVIWRRPAENLANFMKKGSLIGVDGRIQTRSYEGQDGKLVYITEVVADSVQFLESKGSGNTNGGNQQNKNQNDYDSNGYNDFEDHGEPIDISDDDLPF